MMGGENSDMSAMFGSGIKGKATEFAMKQAMKRAQKKMKKGKQIFGILLLIFGIIGAIGIGCQSTPVTASGGNPSIISQGTGFFISSDGYVVTNAHVVEDMHEIGVWVALDPRSSARVGYRAEIIAIDHETDIAILKIDYSPTHVFRLADFRSAFVGDRIFALGFPITHILGSDIVATSGIISSIREIDFQIDALLQPGNSGGPIINERFELIGVAKSILRINTNVGFAVRNTYITSLLPQNVVIRGGNVRSMPDAVMATVQITDGLNDGEEIRIVNNTGHSLVDIFIKPRTEGTIPNSRLERTQVLANTESVSMNLTRPVRFGNRYDFQAIDSNGNLYTQMNVAVSANSVITFTVRDIGTSPGGDTLSGTYVFGGSDSITFSGNNFTIRLTSGATVTGTFTVSGNTFTLAGHGNTTPWIMGTWTIIDSNTIRDSDGDIWRKQQQVSPPPPPTATALSPLAVHSATLRAGEVHYYRVLFERDAFYVIGWWDVDVPGEVASPVADIRVGIRKEGATNFLVPVSDAGNSGGNAHRVYSPSSTDTPRYDENSWYIIEVRGFSSSSSGNYQIVYF